MSHKPRPEDFVTVHRAQLSKLIGKLTYPQHCIHAKGDPTVCDGCHYYWEKKAMEVRTSLLNICKYKPQPKKKVKPPVAEASEEK